MLKKLRIRLTIICALSTGAVVCAVCAILAFVSEQRLLAGVQSAVDREISALSFRLEKESVIDWAWLSQAEADGKLVVHVEINGVPIQYPGAYRPPSGRAQLISAAQRVCFSSRPGERYAIKGAHGEPYIAASAVIQTRTDSRYLLIIKDIGDARLSQMRVFTFGITVCSMLALAVFAWWFSGKAIIPVEEGMAGQRAFVASASHELRSPLAAIRASAETLQYETTDKGRPFAAQIVEECARFTRLVDDLLMLAGADAGRLTIRRGPVEASLVLAQAARIFEQPARERRITLEVMPEQSPLPVFIADEGRIVQVLGVLVDNALRYTPAGGRITLSAFCTPRAVTLRISDTGCGIPDAMKPLVLKRFVRVDDARSGKEHYGLGLSIADDIMRLHTGRLILRDTPGGGLTADCQFPL